MRRRRRRRGLDNEQEGVALAPAASKIEAATSEANPLVSMQQLIGNKATTQFLQRALSPDADSGGSNLVTGMQQLIGNKATTQFLQRALNQDDSTVALKPGDADADTDTDSESETVGAPAKAPGKTENLLAGQQVDRAMFFYAADPKTYTPDIIAAIQTQVGTSPTGTMDRETVQAVARHQAANPPLKVDGMAGPRTLPAVFRQGLDSEKAEEKFAALGKARVTKAQWIVKDTAEQRLEMLLDEANSALKDAGVPELKERTHNTENRPEVFFFNEPWMLFGFRKRMDDGFIQQEEINSLLAQTYHEARRAEQVFSMARMLAGIDKKPEEIATTLNIPVNIATPAKDSKLKPGTPEFIVADGWFQSVFGTGGAKNLAVTREFFAASDELKAAQDAFNADKSSQNQARLAVAQKRHEEAKKAKEDLPDEQDANRVSRNFEEVQKKLGEPPDK